MAAIDAGEEQLAPLEAAAAADARPMSPPREPSERRRRGRAGLDEAVQAELPPLKLERRAS